MKASSNVIPPKANKKVNIVIGIVALIICAMIIAILIPELWSPEAIILIIVGIAWCGSIAYVMFHS
jgi:hypothetical protein